MPPIRNATRGATVRSHCLRGCVPNATEFGRDETLKFCSQFSQTQCGQPEKVSGIEGSQKCMYTSGGSTGPTFVCTGREWAVATQGNCMSGAPPPIDQEVCDFLAQTHCLKEGNCTASHALPQCTESVHRAVQHCAVQCFNMKTGEDPQCDACLVNALSTVESFTRGVPDIYGCCGCFGKIFEGLGMSVGTLADLLFSNCKGNVN